MEVDVQEHNVAALLTLWLLESLVEVSLEATLAWKAFVLVVLGLGLWLLREIGCDGVIGFWDEIDLCLGIHTNVVALSSVSGFGNPSIF